MPMGTEENGTSRPIVTTREPVAPKSSGSKGTVGDRAVMDAVMLVGACWVALFLLSYSLRNHNV